MHMVSQSICSSIAMTSHVSMNTCIFNRSRKRGSTVAEQCSRAFCSMRGFSFSCVPIIWGYLSVDISEQERERRRGTKQQERFIFIRSGLKRTISHSRRKRQRERKKRERRGRRRRRRRWWPVRSRHPHLGYRWSFVLSRSLISLGLFFSFSRFCFITIVTILIRFDSIYLPVARINHPYFCPHSSSNKTHSATPFDMTIAGT